MVRIWSLMHQQSAYLLKVLIWFIVNDTSCTEKFTNFSDGIMTRFEKFSNSLFGERNNPQGK